MLSSTIKEKTKGKDNCSLCQGKGTYKFCDCFIFCEVCHGTEGATMLWKKVDLYIKKSFS